MTAKGRHIFMAKFVKLSEIIVHHSGDKETRSIMVNPESVKEIRPYKIKHSTDGEHNALDCTRLTYNFPNSRGETFVYVEEAAEAVAQAFLLS